jgi:hypothetical protein
MSSSASGSSAASGSGAAAVRLVIGLTDRARPAEWLARLVPRFTPALSLALRGLLGQMCRFRAHPAKKSFAVPQEVGSAKTAKTAWRLFALAWSDGPPTPWSACPQNGQAISFMLFWELLRVIDRAQLTGLGLPSFTQNPTSTALPYVFSGDRFAIDRVLYTAVGMVPRVEDLARRRPATAWAEMLFGVNGKSAKVLLDGREDEMVFIADDVEVPSFLTHIALHPAPFKPLTLRPFYVLDDGFVFITTDIKRASASGLKDAQLARYREVVARLSSTPMPATRPAWRPILPAPEPPSPVLALAPIPAAAVGAVGLFRPDRPLDPGGRGCATEGRSYAFFRCDTRLTPSQWLYAVGGDRLASSVGRLVSSPGFLDGDVEDLWTNEEFKGKSRVILALTTGSEPPDAVTISFAEFAARIDGEIERSGERYGRPRWLRVPAGVCVFAPKARPGPWRSISAAMNSLAKSALIDAETRFPIAEWYALFYQLKCGPGVELTDAAIDNIAQLYDLDRAQRIFQSAAFTQFASRSEPALIRPSARFPGMFEIATLLPPRLSGLHLIPIRAESKAPARPARRRSRSPGPAASASSSSHTSSYYSGSVSGDTRGSEVIVSEAPLARRAGTGKAVRTARPRASSASSSSAASSRAGRRSSCFTVPGTDAEARAGVRSECVVLRTDVGVPLELLSDRRPVSRPISPSTAMVDIVAMVRALYGVAASEPASIAYGMTVATKPAVLAGTLEEFIMNGRNVRERTPLQNAPFKVENLVVQFGGALTGAVRIGVTVWRDQISITRGSAVGYDAIVVAIEKRYPAVEISDVQVFDEDSKYPDVAKTDDELRTETAIGGGPPASYIARFFRRPELPKNIAHPVSVQWSGRITERVPVEICVLIAHL